VACSGRQRTPSSEREPVPTNAPIPFFPSEPGNSLAFVEITSLLPDYQAVLDEARTAAGWDPQKLNQIVAHGYGFLGAFIAARVETVTRETGQPAEYLVVEFRPPQGRDLDKAERLFQRATRRADQGDIRGALPELKRLVAQFPEVAKYHQTLGLAQLELENLDAAEDAQIRQHTPRAIFQANVAMNGAFACWFEEQWPRRTDLLGRFQRTEAWPLAERLYAQWQANAPQWTPGAEYGWIDRWAEILGLTSWFVWRDDIAGPPSEGVLGPPPRVLPGFCAERAKTKLVKQRILCTARPTSLIK